MSDPTIPVLEIEGLEQHLRDPERGEEFVVHVRQRLSIARGSVVALVGPSGCGKTSLLTILGLLRSPSHPERMHSFRMFAGTDNTTPFDLRQLWIERSLRTIERLRRQHIGFALQSGELLPALTARENIAVPLRLNGISGRPCWARVDALVDAFRLRLRGPDDQPLRQGPAYSRVNKLSGGEYQRVALARAIVHQPTLVFVDEPTAALNRDLAWEALELLRSLQTSTEVHGATIMITHDEQLASAFADLIVTMAPVKNERAGEVVSITSNKPTNTTTTVAVDATPPSPAPEEPLTQEVSSS